MNVFVYSEDKLLLLSLADAIRQTGETPFLVPDFQTLQSLIRMTDPDIAFLDEALFTKEKIKKLQNHIFDVLLDFPVTSITDPYFTDYRGKVSETKYRKLSDAIMNAAKKHHSIDGLSPKLSSLLNFLMTHKGEKVETDLMMYHLWNDCTEAHKKTLHTYICKLREKLAESGNDCMLEKVAKSTYRLTTTAQ
ncbi:MAG: helix-turn-helix domain-containing protein [Spirochaetaceae bacterium]|nr:helix-turn-helix domain-containing protein [Spirochaetaceae bacterium]